MSEKHAIVSQTLKGPIRFQKNKRTYDLVVNANVISLQFNVIKKPLATIYKDGIPIGKVISNSPLFGPMNFIVRFDLDEDINFYALIYFIIRLQTAGSNL